MKIVSVLENQTIEKRIAITPEIAKKYLELGLEVELPENYAHNSTSFVSQCREKGIFLRDAENMGITLNSRFVRFAIRSKAENDKIIDCLIDLLDNQ